ncbi:MAG: tetratricopeptide repeat protein, partial [Cyanobacteria bacterium J06648_11]
MEEAVTIFYWQFKKFDWDDCETWANVSPLVVHGSALISLMEKLPAEKARLVIWRDFSSNLGDSCTRVVSSFEVAYRALRKAEECERQFLQPSLMSTPAGASADSIGEVQSEVLASILMSLGIALDSKGDLESAQTKYEAALEMKYAVLGRDAASLSVANSLNNLGNVLEGKGDLEGAQTKYEAALEMTYAVLGRDAASLSLAD